MCGIIGISSNKEINVEKFIEMRDTLKHRGPDDKGLYIYKDKKIALGHRRLSIIDLSINGKQPMCNEDRTIWITFNGEIYNFQEIRAKLINYGHEFTSKTDTEVIIHGYEEWGINVIDRLNGMFAFGIWDENEQLLFLARDRVGIKPLYYYYSKDRFIFSSEIKAILKDNTIPRLINPDGLKYFFMNAYIPAPYSIWKNIYKLPAGHYLIFKNNKIKINKYWELKLGNKIEKEEKCLDLIKNFLKRSIELRFISDVPVGILLSGGIDSSIVTALGSEIKENLSSFSIGFEKEEFSELRYAKMVAKKFKINSSQEILKPEMMNELLNKVLYYFDEPLGVSSIFPTLLLMKMASQHTKVALSGDGGDEIFGGYNWYTTYLDLSKYKIFSKFIKPINKLVNRIFRENNNQLLNRIKRKLSYLSLDNYELYRKLTTPRFSEEDLNSLFSNKLKLNTDKFNIMKDRAKAGLKDIKDLQLYDFYTFLVDCILVKVDRASMAYSLEVRVPFLDHTFIEYVMGLSSNLVFKNSEKKYLLKKVAEEILPYEIIYRSKKGFSAPLSELGFIKDNVQILEDAKSVEDGLFDEHYVKNLIQEKDNKGGKMWLLILFELWYRVWRVDTSKN